MSALTQDPEHPKNWLIAASYLDHEMVQIPMVIRGIHLAEACAGHYCLIHNPSEHHMLSWPLLWDDARKVFQRMCQHHFAHPDPDGWGTKDHVRGCDGCCQR